MSHNYDAKTGKAKSETLTPGSKRWIKVWTEFLTDYMAHTTEMGWFDRVYMSMDERPADVVEDVLDLVESVRNDKGECFRTSLAVFTFDTEYMFDRVTDLSLAYALPYDRLCSIAKHRRELGLATTLYTCGGQKSALENSPYESLYTLWYAEKCGTDGFLRWALDAFNDDPLDSSYHRLFAAGDIYLIYPDKKNAAQPEAKSSPRFEKLAEGCRDITKISYLKEICPEYTERLEKLVNSLGTKNGGNEQKELVRVKAELNSISREAALKVLIAECKSLDYIELKEQIAIAEAVLGAEHTDEQLTSASYTLAKAESLVKKAYDTTEEVNETTAGETVVTTDDTTDTEVEISVTATITDPETVADAQTDTTVQQVSTEASTTFRENEKTGCGSVAGISALAVATGAEIIAVRKKKEN